jgi:hypothetical protein
MFQVSSIASTHRKPVYEQVVWFVWLIATCCNYNIKTAFSQDTLPSEKFEKERRQQFADSYFADLTSEHVQKTLSKLKIKDRNAAESRANDYFYETSHSVRGGMFRAFGLFELARDVPYLGKQSDLFWLVFSSFPPNQHSIGMPSNLITEQLWISAATGDVKTMVNPLNHRDESDPIILRKLQDPKQLTSLIRECSMFYALGIHEKKTSLETLDALSETKPFQLLVLVGNPHVYDQVIVEVMRNELGDANAFYAHLLKAIEPIEIVRVRAQLTLKNLENGSDKSASSDAAKNRRKIKTLNVFMDTCFPVTSN